MTQSVFTPEELQEFRQNFEELDLNGDNHLTREEVGQILASEGEQFELLTTILLFEKFDQDHSNTITWNEFIDFCEHINSKDPDYLLHEIFTICDRDGNGHLDGKEVFRLSELMGLRVSEKDGNATLKLLDANNDQTVDFEEFLQLYHGAIPK